VTRNRYFTLCVLVLIGAFAGGYVANRAMPVAHAQVQPIPQQNVRAMAFILVNQQGKVEATLRNGLMGAELTLDDANGKPRIEAGVRGIVIRDANGRTVWQSPRAFGIVPAGE